MVQQRDFLNGGLPLSKSDTDANGKQTPNGKEGGESFEMGAYNKNWGMHDVKFLLPQDIQRLLFPSIKQNSKPLDNNDKSKQNDPKPTPQA